MSIVARADFYQCVDKVATGKNKLRRLQPFEKEKEKIKQYFAFIPQRWYENIFGRFLKAILFLEKTSILRVPIVIGLIIPDV